MIVHEIVLGLEINKVVDHKLFWALIVSIFLWLKIYKFVINLAACTYTYQYLVACT